MYALLLLPTNLIEITDYCFTFLRNDSLVDHITYLCEVFLFSRIRFELYSNKIQVFHGITFPISIFSKELQTCINKIKYYSTSLFKRINNRDNIREFIHDDIFQKQSENLRFQILNTILVKTMISSKEVYHGRYVESIKTLYKMAVQNIKVGHWKEIDNLLFQNFQKRIEELFV